MDDIPCTKSVGVLTLILLWGLYFSSAQPGFLSLDCGGRGDRTDRKTGIKWIPDDNYIQGGRSDAFNDPSLEFYHRSSRVFSKPLNKSCYHLPITSNVPFLLRLYFVGDIYSGQSPDFRYSIETQEMLSLRNVTAQINPPQPSEKIVVSGGEVLHICLIRILEGVDPFISSIELRPLQQGMYNPVKPGLMLHFIMRFNLGANLSVRYPQDPFDRMWLPLAIPGADNLSSVDSISTNNTQDHSPPVIMETAVAAPTYKDRIDFLLNGPINETLLLLYFANIRHSSESIFFDILINNEKIFTNVELVRNLSAIEVPVLTDATMSSFTVINTSTSKSGPILNGFEWYHRVLTSSRTLLQDVQALTAVKTRFSLSNWVSDPCFAIPWKGIQCNNNSSIVRVLEINLSGMNLTGPIPSSLANMTALINLSLDNNHLTGAFPDLSNLVILERLHLQNNDFSGEVPQWLSQLHNLKELFIQNNNFIGVIPQQLLDTPSPILRHDGNVYLCIEKGSCQPSSNAKSFSQSDGHKVKTIAGVIAGGIAIVGFLLSLGIIVYRKLRREKTVHSDTKSSTYVHGQDHSIVFVPNTSKSRSFSLDEMVMATKNFSNKIGQGGFGSVFLGEFQEGKQIAVKVLSFFSKQGIEQFLNEIELLSRAHHRNLVCLLGYCNASKDLMLVYEYMSGGSVNDHLYGRNVSKYPKLDWKTRLKIALHAAQGLEYLHTNCTPKIIHRDIKTANILLDANLTGKLADFGLSRVATDDVSHVVTAVRGTAGYVDPKYFTTHMLTEKSDVYSFGVVLLEIICGRRPIDITLSEPQIDLVKWATPYVKVDEDAVNIRELVDKSLGNNFDEESITRVAKLAMRCIESEPSYRPSVSDVVTGIKDAMKYEI